MTDVQGYHNLRGEPVDVSQAFDDTRRARCDGLLPPKRRPTVRNGYAAPPGTGPAGRTCRDCRHKVSCSNTGNKSWVKCELRRATWTNGQGTDILAGSPACSRFEERPAP